MTLPDLSIITPCLNRAAYIEEAIQSVMCQKYPNLEHIVVDGGSTDGTLEILSRYPHLKVISEPDDGMYDALNKGVKLAQGDVIGFLNSDDSYFEHSFEQVADRFKDETTLAVVGEAVVFVDLPNGGIQETERFSPAQKDLLELTTIGCPFFNAWFFRKSVFEEIGSFNAIYRIAADRDFMLRFALKKLNYRALTAPIYRYRQHEGSMTLGLDLEKLEKIAKEHLPISDSYLRQSGLSSRERKLIVEACMREAVDGAVRSLKKRDFSRFIFFAQAGSRRNIFWIYIFSQLVMRKMLSKAVNANIIFKSFLFFMPLWAKFFRKVAFTGEGTEACLQNGFLPMPVHFYSPVPDLNDLEQKKIWDRKSSLVGIDFCAEGQIQLLMELGTKYGNECNWSPSPTSNPLEFYTENNTFSFGCAASLHTIIRNYRPAHVIEVGSGNSSKVISAALARNAANGTSADYTIIDPHPAALTKTLPGVSCVIQQKGETCAPHLFEVLQANDILFIDSGHTVRAGSDVNFLYLDVLPRLAPGVIIHIHDIELPREYSKKYFINPSPRVFWTEAYLLQAFLSLNPHFKILLAMNYLMADHLDEFRGAFPHYDPAAHKSASVSFWIQRIS